MKNSILGISVAALAFGAVGFESALGQTAPIAQTQADYDIVAQDLAGALEAFSRASGLSVVTDPALISGKRSRETNGRFSAEAALRQLLAGTGLQARVTPNGVILSRVQENESATATPIPEVEIVVIGAALQNLRAIQARRSADQISEFIVADEIGTLPDYNLSDAIRRVSGVNTIFDEDEGRYIAMRGLDADFTYVSVDGMSLAASDLGGDLGGGRRVLLEAVPSFAVGSTEIRKSISAKHDGQGIGGHVNLITRSAYDPEGEFLSVGGSIGYYDSTGYPTSDNGPSYMLDGAWTKVFGSRGQFGLVVSGSYMFKDRDQERASPGSYTYRDETGVPVSDPAIDDIAFATPAFIVQRAYANEIHRGGALVKLEHLANDAFTHSLTLQYYTQIDDEERTDTFPNAGAVSGWDGETYLVSGADATSRVQVWDVQKWVSSAAYRGAFELNSDTTFQGFVSTSSSAWREDVPRSSFFTARSINYRATPGSADRAASFTVLDPDASAYNDPTKFDRFDGRLRIDHEREDVYQTAVDMLHNVGRDDTGLGFQAGFSFRRTERDFDRNQYRYRQGANFNLNLSQFLQDDGFVPVQGSTPLYVHDARAVFDLINAEDDGNAGQFRYDQAFADANSRAQDFFIREDVSAAYAMAVFEAPRLRLEAGLRAETTDVRARTNNDVTTVTSAGTIVEQGQIDREGSYSSVLPSMAFMYDISPGFRLRTAFSETIGRPSFRSISGTVRTRTDETTGVVEIESGNPNLKPRISRNYDVSLEYYFDRGRSLASIGAFYKDIRNDIFVRTTTLDGGALILTRPENVETSRISGIELSLVKNTFDFLPKPLDGLGASINATFINAEVGVDEVTEFGYRLEQPEFLMNSSVFYRYGPAEARLTYNVTGEQPRSVEVETPYASLWEETFEQLDANLDVHLNEQLRLRVQGRNLLDESRVISEGPGRSQLWDFSDFGPQFWVGLRYRR